jgi:hypothetical protein
VTRTFTQSETLKKGSAVPFYDKAKIMENGVPVTIAPTKSKVLKFDGPSGEVFTTISSFGYINDGNVFYSTADEWTSPLYPNPFNQISAMFSFKRIEQGSR